MPSFKNCRLLSGLTLSLLLAGCAWFGDSSQRAALIAAPQLGNTLHPFKKSMQAGSVWPSQSWWKTFAIPTLNRLIETAVADSPTLKVVETRLKQSQAMVDARTADLYPTVDANFSFSAQRYSANSVQAKFAGEHFRHMVINPFVLRYHLDLWGRDRAALQAAVGEAMASETEVADARLLLSVSIASNYFNLVSAVDRLALTEKIVDCREKLLKLTQARLDSGLISNAPMLTAQIELNNARQQTAALRAEIDLQKNLLAALAGKGPDWGRTIAAERGILPYRLSLPGDLPLRLLAHRPDVVAAKLRAEAAAEEIKVAKTAFYPEVNLFSFAGLHSVSISDVLLQGSSLAYAVGPSIEFPIFEGGRLRANLSYQEAVYDQAVAQYNAQVLLAVQEVADALAAWQKIDTQLTEQRQSSASSVEARRLEDTLNQYGLRDRGGRLATEAAEYAELFRQAALEGEYFKAATQVVKALGGGYFSKVNQ
ncbi:MAG: efflux transporter outer membrane subunit [Methylococcaceae bacterium]|nr:efflux transporter outer membrane subunit [Methylococcaceae bacterium]